MNKKRFITFVMVVLLLFASLSLVMASVGPLGSAESSNFYTSLPDFQGIPIAGNIDSGGVPIGG